MAHARHLSIDFFSAFTTMWPHLQAEKLLQEFKNEFDIIGHSLDFITHCVPDSMVFSLKSSTLPLISPKGVCVF